MNRYVKAVVVIIPFIFQKCTYDSVFLDKEADHKEGEKFIKEFYSHIQSGQFETIIPMCSDTLLKTSPAKDFTDFLD